MVISLTSLNAELCYTDSADYFLEMESRIRFKLADMQTNNRFVYFLSVNGILKYMDAKYITENTASIYKNLTTLALPDDKPIKSFTLTDDYVYIITNGTRTNKSGRRMTFDEFYECKHSGTNKFINERFGST